jgi:hypothetical protein
MCLARRRRSQNKTNLTAILPTGDNCQRSSHSQRLRWSNRRRWWNKCFASVTGAVAARPGRLFGGIGDCRHIHSAGWSLSHPALGHSRVGPGGIDSCVPSRECWSKTRSAATGTTRFQNGSLSDRCQRTTSFSLHWVWPPWPNKSWRPPGRA